MEHKRILKGNFTTLPSHADLIGNNITNAVTYGATEEEQKNTAALAECVLSAREFEIKAKH